MTATAKLQVRTPVLTTPRPVLRASEAGDPDACAAFLADGVARDIDAIPTMPVPA